MVKLEQEKAGLFSDYMYIIYICRTFWCSYNLWSYANCICCSEAYGYKLNQLWINYRFQFHWGFRLLWKNKKLIRWTFDKITFLPNNSQIISCQKYWMWIWIINYHSILCISLEKRSLVGLLGLKILSHIFEHTPTGVNN